VRVGVLALQGDFREHAAALSRLGAEPVLVRRAEDLQGLGALVIPGGESTTIGSLAGRYGLLEPLRRAVAGGLPTLGTCAGMILLASGTTGGQEQPQLGVLDLVVDRNAFGRQVESFEADLEVAGMKGAVHGVFIRAPRVERAGPGVEVLASVDGHPVMVRQGHVLAAAFHPELTGDLRVHRLLLEMAGER
jgi:5'-phosphate synthase pdxT subunit